MPRSTLVYCTLLLCLVQSCRPLLRDGPVSPAADSGTPNTPGMTAGRRQQTPARALPVARSSPQTTPSVTTSQQGMRAYQAQEYRTALQVWQPLAEQGDVDAQNGRGIL